MSKVVIEFTEADVRAALAMYAKENGQFIDPGKLMFLVRGGYSRKMGGASVSPGIQKSYL